jgi:sugar porter (SP) family MFS transporter
MSTGNSRDEIENTFYNERVSTSLLRTLSSKESCWDPTNLKFLFAIRAALVGSIGGLLLGYDLGVMSGALPALAEEYNLSINQQELLTSLMLVGCVFGACVGGFICDGIGRKRTVYTVCVLFLLGAIIMSSARSLTVLYFGRLVVGLGVSISAIVDVSYLTEISPPEFRGSVVGTNELMITVGILLAFCIDYKFSQFPEGWRYMFAFPAVLTVMWAILMCMMPESPRWLLVKGRPEEALRVFGLIEGGSKDEARREFEKASAVVEASRCSSTKSLYKIITEDWRLSMILSVSLMVLQHFSGHGSIIAYAPTIFARAGLGASSAGVATILLGIIKVVFTALSLIAVDFVGRRALLLWGIFGMAVSLVVLSATFEKMTSTATPTRAEEIVAVTSVCTLVASYAVGFGPVTWLVASELFPDEIRGRTMGTSSGYCTHWSLCLTFWIDNWILSHAM